MEPEGAEELEPGVATAASRSAERRAALAATEGFHPLRVRPYVAEPGTEPAESTVKPLIGTAGPSPADTDLGMFPAENDRPAYNGLAYADDAYYGHGYDGLEYDGHAYDGLASDGRAYDGLEYPVEPSGPELFAVGPGPGGQDERRGGRRRRPRRRRRGLVVAAATVAATALTAGAVAVANQLLSAPDRPERALPDNSNSVPDVVLPSSDVMATAAPSAVHASGPTASPTATHRAPSTPVKSVAPPASPVVSAPPSQPPVTTNTPAAPGSVPGSGSGPVTTPTTTPPTNRPTLADPALQMGDTGAPVVDLQQRLRRAYVYMGGVDGRFDSEVRDAVAMFQFWNAITSDPEGVYGPATRTALEQQTSW
ncbi:peptidoglycan-binding protein [Streptomyces sp. H10-C2]|uniref:peptidoglycan-binding domain-containing protein n=1 Tax=unclassified Streptomyces TaxID=2593676 RepID=UPI0024BB0147|nr:MULTISPECIES: peptidoglycan-binding protein [unclassified Streptomyces]MDJ0343663.1 peptidoglycan-binding protein [Streptomyces sp. PH10-H1]MDJ0372410.1 peptidoglycan-binding protein [Streptomyces sp. H10-C2]